VSLPRTVRWPLLTAFRMVSRVSIALQAHRYRYVFILAHMRSGSSLLAHIMNSHPDFVAAGETRCTYRSSSDFQNLPLMTSQILHKPILLRTFVVDKIVYNEFIPNYEVLNSRLLYKCLILIRDPESTLKSLVKRGTDPNDDLFGYRDEKALQYYIDRLNVLTRYGLLLRERALLVEYDELVGWTEDTLATLTRFFGVRRAFTSHYGTHRATGRFDDPSLYIRAGRIVRTPDNGFVIDQESLTAASIAFRQCRKRLEAAGVHVVRREPQPGRAVAQQNLELPAN